MANKKLSGDGRGDGSGYGSGNGSSYSGRSNNNNNCGANEGRPAQPTVNGHKRVRAGPHRLS